MVQTCSNHEPCWHPELDSDDLRVPLFKPLAKSYVAWRPGPAAAKHLSLCCSEHHQRGAYGPRSWGNADWSNEHCQCWPIQWALPQDLGPYAPRRPWRELVGSPRSPKLVKGNLFSKPPTILVVVPKHRMEMQTYVSQRAESQCWRWLSARWETYVCISSPCLGTTTRIVPVTWVNRCSLLDPIKTGLKTHENLWKPWGRNGKHQETQVWNRQHALGPCENSWNILEEVVNAKMENHAMQRHHKTGAEEQMGNKGLIVCFRGRHQFGPPVHLDSALSNFPIQAIKRALTLWWTSSR